MTTRTSPLYIGLMSGTSLDGVDGVLAEFSDTGSPLKTLASAHIPFADDLRQELMDLQSPGLDEIHREALAAQTLAGLYADCINQLLSSSGIPPSAVRAVGAHGQTIRHRPELGYSRQSFAPALLAERIGIDVIVDFRSRDIAAGGQGAPLVPAFHQAVFGHKVEMRVVANIGGISNISVLHPDGRVIGFDTGPGNVLLDWWISQHQQKRYDAHGDWAASGQHLPELLESLLQEAYFALPPPKSTGRDLFRPDWLQKKLGEFRSAPAEDVQATLTRLTAITLGAAITKYAVDASAVYVCGGGACNRHLMQELQNALATAGCATPVQSTKALGVAPSQVEALAFAWLARQYVQRQPGNLPSVTGAKGPRILGALYPA